MSLFAFEGAWNQQGPSEKTAPRRGTHVSLFKHAYRSGDVFHFPEIGSRMEYIFILAALNGAFGLKGASVIQKAYLQLARHLEESPDDPIDLIGFSRGANLALHFANLVILKGIPILKSKQKREITHRLPGKDKPEHRIVYTFDCQPAPPIRFIGIWDMIAAGDLPVTIGPVPVQQGSMGYRLGVPKGIWNAYHAMALDETHADLPVLRLQGAEEVWFMGDHSRLGGGHQDPRLSDIALQWMFHKGMEAGLSFDPAMLENLDPSPEGLLDETERLNSARIVQPGDWVHSSVRPEHYPAIPWDFVRCVH
ncbi:MAG: hypothetical protein A2X46_13430 [Lentisphaerae bacterium GWF2_57_35]|nr:MAG: hypothetical protein A2X46_13430 [Lentisphaerae bacterium GWF2_57_35]